MEGIRLDQELLLKSSSGLNRCGFESHTFFILAYSVTVSTKHFDCFSLGSNPDKPSNNCKYWKPIPTPDQLVGRLVKKALSVSSGEIHAEKTMQDASTGNQPDGFAYENFWMYRSQVYLAYLGRRSTQVRILPIRQIFFKED